MEKQERDRLEELCKPIVEYLLENKDPYTEVVVTMDFIKIKRDELSIPQNIRNRAYPDRKARSLKRLLEIEFKSH